MKHYHTRVERIIYPEGRSVSHKPNAKLVHACDECHIHLSLLFCNLMVESAPASSHDWSPGACARTQRVHSVQPQPVHEVPAAWRSSHRSASYWFRCTRANVKGSLDGLSEAHHCMEHIPIALFLSSWKSSLNNKERPRFLRCGQFDAAQRWHFDTLQDFYLFLS